MKTLSRFQNVQVFDSAELTVAPELSMEGFLRAAVNATRAGIFIYLDENGRPIKALRPEAEVFNAASVATLRGKPITRTHPTALLDTTTVKGAVVGATGDNVERVDVFLRTMANIFDGPTIEAIRAGKTEVSCGYLADVVDTPGIDPTFGAFDVMQTNIRYNHLAVAIDEGRGGPEVRMLMDSTGLTSQQEAPVAKTIKDGEEGAAGAGEGALVSCKLGDQEFQVTPKLAEAIGNHLNGMTAEYQSKHDELAGKLAELGKAKEDAEEDLTKAAEATVGEGADEEPKEGDKPEAKLDSIKTAKGLVLKTALSKMLGTVKGLRTELKTKMDSMSPAALRAAAQEQARLVATVCAVDSKAKASELFDKAPAELKRMTILARDPKAVLDGKDAAYIDGRFDAISSTVKVNLGLALGEALLDNAAGKVITENTAPATKKWTAPPLTASKA